MNGKTTYVYHCDVCTGEKGDPGSEVSWPIIKGNQGAPGDTGFKGPPGNN